MCYIPGATSTQLNAGLRPVPHQDAVVTLLYHSRVGLRLPSFARVLIACAVLAALDAGTGAAALADSSPIAFSIQSMPSTMTASASILVPVQIANRGSDAWDGTSLYVRSRWRTADGVSLDPRLTAVTGTVKPGESRLQCVWLAAPGQPGAATVEWTIVQKGKVGDRVMAEDQNGPRAVSVAARQSAIVRSADTVRAAASLFLFFAMTFGHFAFMFVWLRRFGGDRWSLDELLFRWALITLGSLQALLHALAATVGLTMAGGVAALAILHAALFVTSRRRSREHPAVLLREQWNADLRDGVRPGFQGATAIAGLLVLGALVTQWILVAPRALDVIGTDAAHYHVPHAVNFALGVSLFGTPATVHYYPMGTSVLTAWFITPLRDPLLIDLAPLPIFLLLWFSLGRFVRSLTGAPGLVWGPPLALVFMSTPLMRQSLFVGADLNFVATFLAAAALLFDAVASRRFDWPAGVSLSLALGMLVGSKSMGAFEAAALVGMAAVVIAATFVLHGTKLSWPGWTAGRVFACAALLVSAGGIWLIRNWWLFGSPVAPGGLSVLGLTIFPGRTDWTGTLTLLDDLRSPSGYDLSARFLYWSDRWLGPWFLPAGGLVLGLLIDVTLGRLRARALTDVERRKIGFVVASAVLITLHLLVLVRAPWSSLEGFGGFSLRHALPDFSLYLVAGYACVFMGSVGWWRRYPGYVSLGLLGLAVAWTSRHQDVEPVAAALTPGRLTPWVVGGTIAAAGLAWLVLKRWRIAGKSALAGVVVVAALAAAVDGGLNNTSLLAAAQRTVSEEVACRALDPTEPDLKNSREIYLDVLEFERAAGAPCPHRQFFTTTPWNLPLMLQPPVYENTVFAVMDPPMAVAAATRLAARPDPCNYVIADRRDLGSSREGPVVRRVLASPGSRRLGTHGIWTVFKGRPD